MNEDGGLPRVDGLPRAEGADLRVATNGIELAVTVSGPEPADARDTVLLLHGFPDSRHTWRHQLGALAAAGYRVLAPDLRGFGESDRLEDVAGYRMPNLVADVTGLLDALDVPQAVVVGHDWGAGLAWQVAFRAPERVSRLAVVSVGHGGTSALAGVDQRRMSWYMLWFLFPGVAEERLPAENWRYFREWAWHGAAPGENPDCERQIADLSRPGALTAALNWYRANISPARFVSTVVPDGPTVSCPTMGVWSTHDAFLGREQLAASERFVTGRWRFETVEAGHWVPTEATGELSRLLLDFLGEPA